MKTYCITFALITDLFIVCITQFKCIIILLNISAKIISSSVYVYINYGLSTTSGPVDFLIHFDNRRLLHTTNSLNQLYFISEAIPE